MSLEKNMLPRYIKSTDLKGKKKYFYPLHNNFNVLIDFFSKIFTVNPTDRPTSNELLNHELFK